MANRRTYNTKRNWRETVAIAYGTEDSDVVRVLEKASEIAGFPIGLKHLAMLAMGANIMARDGQRMPVTGVPEGVARINAVYNYLIDEAQQRPVTTSDKRPAQH